MGNRALGMALARDGSIVLAGSTTGNWNISHAGGATDFAACKLDSEGALLWKWQVEKGNGVYYDTVSTHDAWHMGTAVKGGEISRGRRAIRSFRRQHHSR